VYLIDNTALDAVSQNECCVLYLAFYF